MDSLLTAELGLSSLSLTAALFVLLLLICVGFVALLLYWFWVLLERPEKAPTPTFARAQNNPLFSPIAEHWWESQAVFNPAAFVGNGRVHLLYRAMGQDGVSRIGYASSPDGINFDERLSYPVYDGGPGFIPSLHPRYRPLSYRTDLYASGGGWGGSEDPRTVVIDEKLYMSYGMFESWQSIRMAVTSLSLEDVENHRWIWEPRIPISPKEQTNKNWVLFPEKIREKYAILHAMSPTVQIEYVDSLEDLRLKPILSQNKRSGRKGHWDAFVRGAAAPPIKTPRGWLLLYHGMNPEVSSIGYKVGAMLLDLADPTKILYRSEAPLLEPTEWYENDWKPGVVYASGAVHFKDDLLVYYGGGDKYIAIAHIPMQKLLDALTTHRATKLLPVKSNA